METATPSLPILPCPSCNANILERGFHNTCTETQSLREDNFARIAESRLRIWHEGNNYELAGHTCDVKAFCSACDELLPWPLYTIRALDATIMQLVPAAIAKLLKKAEGPNPDSASTQGEEK